MAQNRLVLVAVLLTSFVVPFMGSAINLAIPAMGEEFNVNPATLSWVVSIYILGSVAILLPIGRWSDITGRKRTYTTGLVFMIIFTGLSAFAWSVESLILFRLGQGLASSMLFSTGMTMIVSVYKPGERGKIIGYSAASTYIGLSLGPVLGGVITHCISWRGIFCFTVILLLLSLYTILKVKAEWYGAQGGRLDYIGSFCYMVAGVGVLYGCSNLAIGMWAWCCLAGGCVFFALFIWQQLHSDIPLLDLKLFRENKVFAMSNLAAMINYSATFAIGFSLSLYLQLVRGFDAPSAGLVLLIQPCLMALFSPKAGALSDRIEPRLVASLGMTLNTIGLIAFAFLDANTPIWQIGIAFAIIGLGFALFSSPNNNAIMGAVEPPLYGIAASVLAFMRLMGQAMSMAIVTLILSIYAAASVQDTYNEVLLMAINCTFAVFAGLCAAGILASLARGKS